MSLKHTWSQTIKNDAGAAVAVDAAHIVTGDSESNFLVEVGPNDTVEVDVSDIDVDIIASAFLASNKAVTVNTNAVDATGGQSIDLIANKAFAWNSDMAFANPFTPGPITSFFIINESDSDTATVRGGFLLQTD